MIEIHCKTKVAKGFYPLRTHFAGKYVQLKGHFRELLLIYSLASLAKLIACRRFLNCGIIQYGFPFIPARSERFLRVRLEPY